MDGDSRRWREQHRSPIMNRDTRMSRARVHEETSCEATRIAEVPYLKVHGRTRADQGSHDDSWAGISLCCLRLGHTDRETASTGSGRSESDGRGEMNRTFRRNSHFHWHGRYELEGTWPTSRYSCSGRGTFTSKLKIADCNLVKPTHHRTFPPACAWVALVRMGKATTLRRSERRQAQPSPQVGTVYTVAHAYSWPSATLVFGGHGTVLVACLLSQVAMSTHSLGIFTESIRFLHYQLQYP